MILGDHNDRTVARQLLDSLHWPFPTMNLTGRLSLEETTYALGEADGLLSNDSSLAHIAEAVGTPVAVLFGPTVEAFGFAPRAETSRAFSSTVGCRPCSKHGKLSCRFDDHLCFQLIPPKLVADHLFNFVSADDARHKHKKTAVD